MRPAAWLWACATCVLLGCTPEYGGLELELTQSAPGGVTVDADGVELPVGVAILVTAYPDSDSARQYDASFPVELRAEDDTIVQVRARPDSLREHTIVGLSVGETCIEVWVDGSQEDCIPARVLAQP